MAAAILRIGRRCDSALWWAYLAARIVSSSLDRKISCWICQGMLTLRSGVRCG
jgi:hypothetical protein